MVFHILIIGYFSLLLLYKHCFPSYYHRSRFCDSIQYLFDRIVQIQFFRYK